MMTNHPVIYKKPILQKEGGGQVLTFDMPSPIFENLAELEGHMSRCQIPKPDPPPFTENKSLVNGLI